MNGSLSPSRPAGLLADDNGDGRQDFQDLFKLPPDTSWQDLGKIPPDRSILRPAREAIDPAAIVRTILDENPGMRILAIGERHATPPLRVLSEAVRQLRARGKSVVFAFELVAYPARPSPGGPGMRGAFTPEERSAMGRLELVIRRFNAGETSGADFLAQIRQEFTRSPLLASLYGPAARQQLLQTIEVAIGQGATQFHAIDPHEGYVAPTKPHPGPFELNPNRDRTMAKRVEYLAKRNGPDSVVVGVFGGGHVTETPLQNDDRRPPMLDALRPMGHRLDALFGQAYVSLRSFGVIDAMGGPDQAKVERDAASILVLDPHYLPLPDEAYDYTSL